MTEKINLEENSIVELSHNGVECYYDLRDVFSQPSLMIELANEMKDFYKTFFRNQEISWSDFIDGDIDDYVEDYFNQCEFIKSKKTLIRCVCPTCGGEGNTENVNELCNHCDKYIRQSNDEETILKKLLETKAVSEYKANQLHIVKYEIDKEVYHIKSVEVEITNDLLREMINSISISNVQLDKVKVIDYEIEGKIITITITNVKEKKCEVCGINYNKIENEHTTKHFKGVCSVKCSFDRTKNKLNGVCRK